jgi:hypothetical protein
VPSACSAPVSGGLGFGPAQDRPGRCPLRFGRGGAAFAERDAPHGAESGAQRGRTIGVGQGPLPGQPVNDTAQAFGLIFGHGHPLDRPP